MTLQAKLDALTRNLESIPYTLERFEGACFDDVKRLETLLDSGRVTEVCDMLLQQLGALIEEEHPDRTLSAGDIQALVQKRTAGRPINRYGTWFFYPWSGRLVHLLPEDEFTRLRTCRNRYKITPEEQSLLSQKTVGVVGLSVGRAATACLALEGVGGELRLADFDHLELSNLNRLRHGVGSLGLPKAVLAAREVLEIDPYRRVRIYPEGIHSGNIDQFMSEEGGLDLLVEECDSLDIKVQLREAARSRNIPVVMDTSDRGMLDVERFDLEPERPLLHGLLGDYQASDLTGLSNAEKVPLILRILGGTNMSARMAASLAEVDETTTSWPQLASDVALGGALVCNAARRILLGSDLASGRYYIDFEEQLRQPSEVKIPPAYEKHPLAVSDRRLPPLTPRTDSHLSRSLVESWVTWGTAAPSPHNHQGWKFVFERDVLHCEIDETRIFRGLDTGATASLLAVGCAIENIVLAAQATGFIAQVHYHEAMPRVASLTFIPGTPNPEYVEQIRQRVTNRRITTPSPMPEEVAAALETIARKSGGYLALNTDLQELKILSELAREAGRLMFLQADAYHEIVDGIRIGRNEVEQGDGIDVETMEASQKDIAALSLIRHAPVGAALRTIGLGSALGNAERDSFLSACGAGLLVLPEDSSTHAYARGGRVFQRVWLEATRLNLSVHPVSNLPWMYRRLDTEAGRGYSEEAVTFLRENREQFDSLFPAPPGARLGLLRFSLAEKPSARTLRRPLTDVFEWRG
jgi:hypothetical protein